MVRQAIVAACLIVLALPAPVAIPLGWAQNSLAEQDEIRTLMRQTWERPGAPLSVDPVVVLEGYSIAGWVQDDRGGRALLRKKQETWEVVLCSGDHLRSPETITAVGASEDLARRLVQALLAAEGGLPPDRLVKLSSFEGIVRMDAAGPTHGHR